MKTGMPSSLKPTRRVGLETPRNRKMSLIKAFTLIELLVVVTIVLILIALLFPVFTRIQETANRVVCANNLHQLALGAIVYAGNNRDGNYTGTTAFDDDCVGWLYPNYVKDLKVFICPSTSQFIKPTTGLILSSGNSATYRDCVTNLPSYECYGWTRQVPQHKTLFNVGNYSLKGPASTTYGIKGIIPGPQNAMLFLDQDQLNPVKSPAQGGGYQNFPDVTDNHGADGNNVAFCDGHVEFIGPKDWKRRYVMSEDAAVKAVNWPP